MADLTAPFPLVDIAGAPYERGVAYGRQTGDRVLAGIDIYKEAFAKAGIDWSQALSYADKFAGQIEAFDTKMMREIEGIAAGAEQPVTAIVALNARTEIIFWRDNELNRRAGGAPGLETDYSDECTAAAALPCATANGHMIHGQNWDWNPRCAESAVVVRIDNPDGPNILTFVEAGQLARHGFNSAGVALTVNGLQCHLDGGRVGIANPLIRRRLLLSDSLAGALNVVMNTPTSFSHNLIVSHRDGYAVDIETTPTARYWLQPEKGVLAHANHFKCPIARQEVEDIGLARCPESLYRDHRMQEHMTANAGSITVDTFKEGFADRFGSPDAILRSPKVRPGGNLSGTVASLIMDTTDRKLLAAPSPYLGPVYTEYDLPE